MRPFISRLGLHSCAAIAAAGALAAATPAAAVIVFSGFDVGGLGVVTTATGTSPDTPPVGLNIQVGGQLQLPTGYLGIPADASGPYHFDQSSALIMAQVYVMPGQGYPISGWLFQSPSTLDFTLDHGTVTDFAFRMKTPYGDYLDIDPGTFFLHFITGLTHEDVYEFGGTWDYEGANSHFTSLIVPEPAEWMLMVLGFGLAGAALRRSRAAARVA